MKLKDVVEIQAGYQFRGKVRPAAMDELDDAVPFIQIKDVDANEGVNNNDVVRVKISSNTDRYKVLAGDVLFLARGHHQFAVAIEQPLQDAIVTSYFFILRLKTEQLIPGYLAWFLNQSRIQWRWKQFIHGSHMPLVAKSVLEDVQVDMPNSKTQQQIVELDRLRHQEERLIRSIQEKRNQLVNTICMKAVLGPANE